HARAVRNMDPTAVWSSINANYLPPSGASLIHPHLQSAHDAHGLTGQRLLVERSGAWSGPDSYWVTLMRQEVGGPRFVGTIGRGMGLTPFPPLGFTGGGGMWGGGSDVPEMTDQDANSLGAGLSRILAAYREWNLTSFNFAII